MKSVRRRREPAFLRSVTGFLVFRVFAAAIVAAAVSLYGLGAPTFAASASVKAQAAIPASVGAMAPAAPLASPNVMAGLFSGPVEHSVKSRPPLPLTGVPAPAKIAPATQTVAASQAVPAMAPALASGWTVTLTATVGTTVALTATVNQDLGGFWLEIFDSSETGTTNYLKWCSSGTTCSVTAVPGERQASYIAVVGTTLTNKYADYPAAGKVAESAPLLPPAWSVALAWNGTKLVATSNYAGGYLEIFDISEPQTDRTTYLGWCNTGPTCSMTPPANGHRFIATAGSISNTFPPGPLYATSNTTGVGGGPSGPNETAGGSNPAELNQCYTCKGDPVNTSTGEFFQNATDVSIPGRGPLLEVKRSYSSQRSAFDSPFGPGWTFDYNTNLVVAPSGSVDVHQENGSMVTFAPSTGGYTAPQRVLAALNHNADGTWTYTRKAKEIFDFDSNGLLTRIRNLNGDAITLIRASGLVTAASDGAGRTVTFAYDGSGHVTTVTDPANQVTSYAYDAAGRLTSATAPGGAITSYGYDSSNLLTTVTDPNGKTTTNVYDPEQRVTQQTDRAGGVRTFQYTSTGSTALTYTTSPAGRITREEYTGGLLTSVVDGYSSAQQVTWMYAYDPATLGVTKVTDPLNHATSSTYDASGNRLSTTDPDGRTTSYTYDALNDPISVTDAAGTTTTMSYDSAGNLLTRSTPLTGTGQTSSTSYGHADAAHLGDLTSVTDPNGNATTYTYDVAGNRTSAADPLGNTTRTAYDQVGRTVSATTARGNATTYAYDPAGRLSKVTDALNHTTTYGYDQDGKRTTVTDAQNHTTTYAYDGVGRLVSTTNPDGTSTSTAYDSDGNPTSVTDPKGHATVYLYDALNRITTSTDPLTRVTSYAYDAASHLTGLTDASGRKTTTSYDPAGQKTATTYSDGVTPNASYTYTQIGQPATIIDGTGTTTNTYDSLGRLTSQKNGNSQTTSYVYDLAGNLTTLGYPNGHPVTRAYDTGGRLTGITDWTGHTTTFSPDADGNNATTGYGNGVATSTTLDAAGRVAGITDTGPGNTPLASFSYTRDPSGNLASTTVTGITTPNEDYTYTNRNQLAAVNAAAYSYDPAGNPTALATGATLSYDAANQPTGYTQNTTTTTITSDSQGNRLTGPGPNGSAASYAWNQANQLTNANGATYTYSSAGLRNTRTPAGGTTQHFAWDTQAGVPLMLTDGTTSYLYDDAGNPVEQIDAAGTPLFYQHDQYGSTRILTDTTGSVAATFTYDANGNLTGKTGTADTPLRWNGQLQDTDTGLYYLRARYYDPQTTQFLNVDPLAVLTQAIYAYANNNPLNMQDPLGLWGWSETLGTVGAVVGIAALLATGPLALGLGVVAIGFSVATTVIDYNDHADGFTMGMDFLSIIPGVGALGKDASVLYKAARAGTAEAKNSFRLANLAKAPGRDVSSWFAAFLGTDIADAKSLSEDQQTSADSATGSTCQ